MKSDHADKDGVGDCDDFDADAYTVEYRWRRVHMQYNSTQQRQQRNTNKKLKTTIALSSARTARVMSDVGSPKNGEHKKDEK